MSQFCLCRISTGRVYIGEPQIKVIYFFSRLRWNGHIPCVHCERETADFESMPTARAQTFSLLILRDK